MIFKRDQHPTAIKAQIKEVYLLNANSVTNGIFESRENNLDFLRLLLALSVIYSHSFPLGGGPSANEPLNWFTHGQSTIGTMAVDSFFILSGFLVTNSFLRSKSVFSYFKKRIARIYPAFIVCMCLCVLAVSLLGEAKLAGNGLAGKLSNLAFHLAILHEPIYLHSFSYNFSHKVDASVWTICYEFYCYIAVAVLGIIGVLGSRKFILGLLIFSVVGMVAFSIAFSVAPPHSFLGHLFATHAYLAERIDLRDQLIPMYLSGVAFYLFRDVIPHKIQLALPAALLLLVSAFVPHLWFATFSIAGAYLLFWVGFHPKLHLQRLTSTGDYSYGIYLYAFPIQQIILAKHGHAMAPFTLFLLAVPITALCGVLSWHLVEKRFLSKGRRKGKDAPILPTTAVYQSGSAK